MAMQKKISSRMNGRGGWIQWLLSANALYSHHYLLQLLVGVWRILSLVYSSVFNNTQDIHGPAFDLYSYSPTLVSMLNIRCFCCGKNSVETKGRHKNTKVKKKKTVKKQR